MSTEQNGEKIKCKINFISYSFFSTERILFCFRGMQLSKLKNKLFKSNEFSYVVRFLYFIFYLFFVRFTSINYLWVSYYCIFEVYCWRNKIFRLNMCVIYFFFKVMRRERLTHEWFAAGLLTQWARCLLLVTCIKSK